MFKMKNIYQEIDIGDWSGGYSSSSSNESYKKNFEESLTKKNDSNFESRSSSHESVDTVPIFTTMFTGTTL